MGWREKEEKERKEIRHMPHVNYFSCKWEFTITGFYCKYIFMENHQFYFLELKNRQEST